MSCEINKDRVWSGQYYCAVHCVWYRDDDKAPDDLCPAGELEARAEKAEARADELEAENDRLRREREKQ